MSAPLPEGAGVIGVVMPSWVGDAVMATPVLRAIRERRPGARIVALARPGIDEVLAGGPCVDETIVAPKGGVASTWRSARRMARSRPEALLLLPNSFRAGVLSRLTGCRVRIGYRRDGRGFLLTHPIEPPSSEGPIATVDFYARLACEALGASSIDRGPALGVTEAERARAEAILEGVARPFVLLNPGGNKPGKRWPAERFAAVADALGAWGLGAAVNASPGERAIAREVVERSRSAVVDLSERGVTLGSLKAVVAEAGLVVTNDTGPRHLAWAFGVPTVALFGPTDHRWTTLPGARERALLAEPFLPAELIADRHAVGCRIERIRVGDVIAAAEALWRESGAGEPGTGETGAGETGSSTE